MNTWWINEADKALTRMNKNKITHIGAMYEKDDHRYYRNLKVNKRIKFLSIVLKF